MAAYRSSSFHMETRLMMRSIFAGAIHTRRRGRLVANSLQFVVDDISARGSRIHLKYYSNDFIKKLAMAGQNNNSPGCNPGLLYDCIPQPRRALNINSSGCNPGLLYDCISQPRRALNKNSPGCNPGLMRCIPQPQKALNNNSPGCNPGLLYDCIPQPRRTLNKNSPGCNRGLVGK